MVTKIPYTENINSYHEDAFINHFKSEEKLQRLGWGAFQFYALFESAHIKARPKL